MAVSEKSISDKIETASILEEIEKERANNGLAIPEKYSHKEDLENLLKLAEDLKESCDKTKIRIKNHRLLQIVGIVFSSFFIIISFSAPTDFSYYSGKVLIIGIISFLAILLLYNSVINSMRKTYLADKSALSEVLQLLRETSNVIAEQEEWSILSRAEFRIRLSRFNLEEKSKSAFNFFA